MKKIYYWFLNFVAGIPNSLGLIIPYDRDGIFTPEIDILFTPFKLTTNEIIEILHGLFQDKLLLAITSTEFEKLKLLYLYSLENKLTVDELSAKGFTPSFQEIKAQFKQEEIIVGQEKLYYFLTPQGRDMWESVF
jgi:H2-forming N5,N10-methylenetetrahydromethanopterin dehydrogenase-like enzyme